MSRDARTAAALEAAAVQLTENIAAVLAHLIGESWTAATDAQRAELRLEADRLLGALYRHGLVIVTADDLAKLIAATGVSYGASVQGNGGLRLVRKGRGAAAPVATDPADTGDGAPRGSAHGVHDESERGSA